MTTCSTFASSIKKRVEAGKDLDTIANELCTDVKFDRAKVIRVIKDFLGEDYLIKHAKTLQYDVDKAQLAKKRKQKPLEKIDTTTDNDNTCKLENSDKKEMLLNDVAETLKELIKSSSESTVLAALESVLHREIHYDS